MNAVIGINGNIVTYVELEGADLQAGTCKSVNVKQETRYDFFNGMREGNRFDIMVYEKNMGIKKKTKVRVYEMPKYVCEVVNGQAELEAFLNATRGWYWTILKCLNSNQIVCIRKDNPHHIWTIFKFFKIKVTDADIEKFYQLPLKTAYIDKSVYRSYYVGAADAQKLTNKTGVKALCVPVFVICPFY